MNIGIFPVMLLTAVLSTAAIGKSTSLPNPTAKGTVSVEETMDKRATVREFTGAPLNLTQVSQLLWAAYGFRSESSTSKKRRKVVPSAGALYPLEIYLVTGNVKKLKPGVYRYNPKDNSISEHFLGDSRKRLAIAALSQNWLSRAPACIVISGIYAKTKAKYGKRAKRYVHMESGNVNQNIYLQAASLGLKAATIGAFKDSEVKKVLKLPEENSPLLIMPVGY